MKNIAKVFFFIFIILFSLGQLQRVQLNESIAFYIHDVLLAIWIIVFITYKKQYVLKKLKHLHKFSKINKKILSKLPQTILIFWILFTLIWGVINNGFNLKPILYALRIILYILSITSLKAVFTKNKQPLLLKKGFIFAGLLILFWGILQYIFIPDTRFLSILGWDDHYYRLISTHLDPGFTGMILVLTFFYLLSIDFLKISFLKKQTQIKILLLFSIVIGILLTYSRASYLAFIVGILILLIKYILTKYKPENKLLLSTLIFFLVAIPFLPRPTGEGIRLERTSTISSRQDNINSHLGTLKTHEWIIGRGLFATTIINHNNTNKKIEKNLPQHATFPDNIFVLIITSGGIIGLFLSMLVAIPWLRKLYYQDPYVFASVIAVLVHSLFNNTLLQPFVFLMLLV